MSKLVKDFVEVGDFMSLDGLIEQLVELKAALPGGGEAQVRMRGDDIFGRHLCVSYMRPQTDEEAECEARYADAYRDSRERELTRLQDELGYCALPRGRKGLRIVA